MHKKFGEDLTCSSEDVIADRQTDTLITILRCPIGGRSNYSSDQYSAVSIAVLSCSTRHDQLYYMPTVKGRSHHARMCSPMQCEQPLMWITGANFHRAMVATAPRRKTPYRALSCEELDPALIFSLCFIAFVQKITFFLGKTTKTVATRAALFDSDTPNRLPAGGSLRTCPLPSSPAPSDHVSSSAVLGCLNVRSLLRKYDDVSGVFRGGGHWAMAPPLA